MSGQYQCNCGKIFKSHYARILCGCHKVDEFQVHKAIIDKLDRENKQLKADKQAMKCCGNCKYNKLVKANTCSDCKRAFVHIESDKWELAE